MTKKITFFIIASIFSFSSKSQEKASHNPKLVVGIVIDQMRYDYLTRYADRYGEDGFNRVFL
jgi:predicted AlkP superfamily pyrophosphatase or phosphodiesterase